MEASQDMPQAASCRRVRMTGLGFRYLERSTSSRWLRAKAAGFVPVRGGRWSFQVLFVRRMYCGQEKGSEEEGRQESREEVRQEGREESGQEVGWCGWRFAAVGLLLPGQSRRAARETPVALASGLGKTASFDATRRPLR